jgi:hypothetical protein
MLMYPMPQFDQRGGVALDCGVDLGVRNPSA